MSQSIRLTEATPERRRGCPRHGFQDFRVYIFNHGIKLKRKYTCFICRKSYDRARRDERLAKANAKVEAEFYGYYTILFVCGHQNTFVEPEPQGTAYCIYCGDWKEIKDSIGQRKKREL